MPQYTQVAVHKERLSCTGAPVTIEAWALLHDDITDSQAAQVKLRSIDKRGIASVTVHVTPQSADGVTQTALDGVIDGLEATKGQYFGSDAAIPLPAGKATDLQVSITSVTFADGSSWTSAPDAQWLPAQKEHPFRLEGKKRTLVIAACVVAAAVVVAVALVTGGLLPGFQQSDPRVSDLAFSDPVATRYAMLEGTFTNTGDSADYFLIYTSLERDGERVALGWSATGELEPGESYDFAEPITTNYNGFDFDDPLSSSNLPRIIGLMNEMSDAETSWAWDDDHSFASIDDVTIGRTIVISATDLNEACKQELNSSDS